MIRRSFLSLLLTLGFMGGNALADNQAGYQDITGTWYFMVTIDGIPPCQCIQIDTFSSDGNVEGPANDRFSGDQRGRWVRTSHEQYSITFLQNSIDKDGNAAGLFVIKSTFALTGKDAGTGKFTFQILSNSGAVVATGTGSFKGVRIQL
jgi:hypothetical protein